MYDLPLSSILILAGIIFYMLYHKYLEHIKTTKKLSENGARAYVLNKAGELLSHETEYTLDDALLDDLIRTLAPYNQLQDDKVPWNFKNVGRFKLPCINLGLISKNGTVNFPMIKADLSNSFEAYLTDNGYEFSYRILIREHRAPRYTVSIIYATTQANKENFSTVEKMVADRAQKEAINAASPVTDPKLEGELQQLDN